MASLTFAELISKSESRSLRWHQASQPWTPADWAIAVFGEVGEMCNALKKLNRILTNAPNINEPGRQLSTIEEAKDAIGDEIADYIIYTPCLAASLGIDLEKHIIRKFNQKSEEYGFPERLDLTSGMEEAHQQVLNNLVTRLAKALGVYINHRTLEDIMDELCTVAERLRYD